jgi:hypothetical protein
MAQAQGAAQEAADREALLPASVRAEEDEKPRAPRGPAAGPSYRSAPPPPAEKGNFANYGVSNEAARRREDDTANPSGQTLGVVGLLRNPRNRLYLATAVAATPFLLSFTFYTSQFSFFGQFIIGILCGLCVQGVYLLYALHRKHQRKSKVLPWSELKNGISLPWSKKVLDHAIGL